MVNQQKGPEKAFSIKDFFIPFTTSKAIHWFILIGIIVYSNCVFNAFVWDDKTYDIANSQLYGLNFLKLFGPNVFNMLGYYRPLLAVYFAILYSVFGQTPFFYHVPQILLHISNTILVFILFKTFFRKSFAFLLSLIFLVHPIQTEAVVYIGQTESVMFFFFGMLAFVLSRSEHVSNKKLILTGFFLLLSFLVQESAVFFILLLLIYRLLFTRGKLRVYGLASIIVVCIYSFVRFGLFHIALSHRSFIPIATVSFTDRLLNIPAITWYYLKTFFFPANLIIDQQWVIANFNFQTFYFPLVSDLLFFLLVFVFGFYLFLKQSNCFKAYLFFIIWFFIGLGIHEQLIPLDLTVADRWFYIPMVGLIGMIGIFIETFLIKTKRMKEGVYMALAIIIVILSIRTMVRNTNWQNAITLYEHDAKLTNSFDLEANLGQELYLAGDTKDALIHYKNSIKLLPFDRTLNNIGVIYEREGKYQLAKQYYIKAIQSQDPMPPYQHDKTLYENVSRMLVYFGDPKKAEKYINEGLNVYPKDYVLLLLRGMDENKLYENNEAIKSLQAAYLFAPTDAARQVIKQYMNDPKKKIPITDFY
jgi:protein O-mannosyl-transferase